MKKIIFLCSLLVGLGSCASISLTVDLYDGELPIDENIAKKLVQLDDLAKEVDLYVENKKYVYQTYYELYLSIQELIHKDDYLESNYNHYLEAMNQYFEVTGEKVAQFNTALDSYKAYLREVNSQKEKSAINDFEKIIDDRLQGVKNPFPEDTPNMFDEFMVKRWKERTEEFNQTNIEQLTGEPVDSKALARTKTEMNDKLSLIEDLYKSEGILDIESRNQLAGIEAAGNMKEVYLNAGSFIAPEKIDKVVNNARNLAFLQFLHSQSEDYGDPAWKIVARDKNKNKEDWKHVYGKTKFTAKGKSSVIIVRETPVEFKIKQGENDPKSIIKSQLIVSRSLVNVALAVSGLGQGVGDAGISGTVAEEEPSPSNTENSLELIRERNEFYDRTVEAFNESLKNFEIELSAANDSTKIQEISNRLNKHLETYKLIFETLKTNGNEKR